MFTRKDTIASSPGMMLNQIDQVQKTLRKTQKDRARAKKLLAKLQKEKNGDYVICDNNNFRPEIIFDDKLEKLAEDHFGSDGNSEVTDKKMQKCIFDEMLLQAKRAQ